MAVTLVLASAYLWCVARSSITILTQHGPAPCGRMGSMNDFSRRAFIARTAALLATPLAAGTQQARPARISATWAGSRARTSDSSDACSAMTASSRWYGGPAVDDARGVLRYET